MIAQAQIGTEGTPKLEFFRNFADEMGNGNSEFVHTKMFGNLKDYLEISSLQEKELIPEALMCGNLSSILSLYRGYYNFCIGYLGMTEALAPRRFQKVVKGGQRLGIPDKVMVYHLELMRGSPHPQEAGWGRIAREFPG